jgi:hypothetical protein
MINNTEKIRDMLFFNDKDDFYFLQILKRRKDNPDMEKDMMVIDNFYIGSMESFDKKIPHVIDLCNIENARAYFRVNKRNYAKLGPHMLKRVVDIVFTENCKALRSTFDSVAGEYHSDPDKKWVVDVDYNDVFNESNDGEKNFSDLIYDLSKLQSEAKRVPMLVQIPTKNGIHIITRPFNVQEFRKLYPKMDIHKDNPTLLYCP